jgi:tetratricopeptide (TPR) repeat protein
MNSTLLLQIRKTALCVLALTVAFAGPAYSQTKMSPDATGTSMSPNRPSESGSPSSSNAAAADSAIAGKEKVNPELVRKFREAAAAMEKKDYATAHARLDDADKLAGANTSILSTLANMRGAVYVKQKDWAKAEEAFGKSVQFDSRNFGPRYNLGEIMFMQKKYPEARQRFQKLASEEPKNDLVRYKVFLTYLAENNMTEARKLLDSFDFYGDLPAYYFAHAAWEFKNNNPKEGRSWILSAQKIYPVFKNALFADSLSELGLITQQTATANAQK